MARQSKVLVTAATIEDCESAFADYNRCLSELEIFQGKMNGEITAIKEKYEARINKLQEQRDQAFEAMQSYAEANRDEFGDKKSMEFTHGSIGFRTGMPKLSPRKGFKWPAVLELVKANLKRYIRTKEEIDKEGILSDRARLDLKSVGLEVKQDETFFVAPNLEVVTE